MFSTDGVDDGGMVIETSREPATDCVTGLGCLVRSQTHTLPAELTRMTANDCDLENHLYRHEYPPALLLGH